MTPEARSPATSFAGGRRLAAARPGLTAFSIVLIASLVVALIQGSKPFYWDSGEYWSLGSSFDRLGHFSFSSYQYDGLRGYALPLVYDVLRHLGFHAGTSDGTVVNLFNSVLFALLATALAPALAAVAWPERRWGLLPRLGLGALLLIFWSGYLAFPLSDFPAVFAGMVALIAVSRADSPVWLGLAGLAASFAVNTRPAYFLLIPLLLFVLAWTWWRERSRVPTTTLRRVICVGALLVGMLIVAVPQALYEQRDSGSYSPLPGGTGLAGLQYTQGLKMQRYETYVGALGLPSMVYRDPHTLAIREELDHGEVTSTGEYLRIVAEHPVTMAGVFLRHIVNGLDQRYTTPYVEHLEPPARKILRLAGFLLVFLALFRVLWPRGRRSFGPARWRYPLTLLACCATVPASAVEPRYMIPVFLLAGMVVLTPGWPNPLEIEATGVRRFRTLGLALTFLAVYLVVVGIIVQGATDHLLV